MHHIKIYRQDVPTFRAELNKLLAVPENCRSGRLIVDSKGYKSRDMATKSIEQRMLVYGNSRLESVARILGLFEMMRDLESLFSRSKPILPTPSGAVWQSFRGTQENNACHTCPTHLQLDGHLPTMQTLNVGLQRHLIVEFANCVLMPRGINEIDKVFDDKASKLSFVEAAKVVLNERNVKWTDGVGVFLDGVRDFLGPARDCILYGSPDDALRDPKDQMRVDMFSAYYEGMFIEPLDESSVKTMLTQAEAEVGRESSSASENTQIET